MSDSEGPKAKGRPSWQQQEPSSLPEHPDNTPANEQTEQAQQSEPRASLIENASAFLKDESIRDAPIARKKLFLESKGLTESEIDNLLEIQQQQQQQPPPEAAAIEDDYGTERQEPSQSIIIPPPTSPSPNAQTPSTSEQQEEEEEEEEAPTTPQQPPIITYPEFLLHAQQKKTPAPLITATRLLTTLYVASGAAATVYGTSNYIVEPMLSSLTAARHSLLDVASAHLETLNSDLESAVSKVPEKARIISSEKKGGNEDEDGDSDTDTDTGSLRSSDGGGGGGGGARFFQRSAGTQTSPRLLLSRSSDSSSVSVVDEAGEQQISSPAQGHANALSGIQSKLSDLLPPTEARNNPLRDSVYELRAYLQRLPHADSLSHVVVGKQRGGRKGEGAVDAVASVKAEILGVKGVLLSARNFPSAV